MNPPLRLLSAGAAQGVVSALAPTFENEMRCELRASFMPVGALREKFLAGEACDVVVSTETMLERFGLDSRVDRATISRLGTVHTSIAVRAGEPLPGIDSRDRLSAALSAAPRIYFPDPERATAGIHFVKVLRELGLYEKLAPRLAAHANGAAAMAALATADETGCLGCTQATEIRFTDGVMLVGPLPAPYDLGTTYAAAASASTRDPALARRLVALLAGSDAASLRSAAGFEP